MDFVRAQMTEAERQAERQFEMIREATAQAIRDSLPRQPTAQEREQRIREDAAVNARAQRHIRRKRQEHLAHLGLAGR